MTQTRDNSVVLGVIFGQRRACARARGTIMKRPAESNEDKGIKTPYTLELSRRGRRYSSLSKRRRRFARGGVINLISFGERAGLIARSDGST